MTYSVFCITTVDLSLRFLVFDLLRDLQVNDFQVTGVSAPGPYVSEVEAAGISVVSIPMTRRVTPFKDIVVLWRLWRLLKSAKPNIVHTHTPKANLLGQIAARLAGVPVRVENVHGLYFTSRSPLWRQLLFGLMERMSAWFPQVVFLSNQEDLDSMKRLRLCEPSKLRLLPGGTGIDLARFTPTQLSIEELTRLRLELGLPVDALVIGFVGRMVKEKGLLELFTAFKVLYEEFPHAWLLVIGPCDTSKPDAVSRDDAHRYGIGDRCIFAGMRSDVHKLYPLMDIFVLPSHREGLSLSTMEAQAMMLPVVTSDARGCYDSITPDVTGFLFPVGDADALAGCLRRLLANKTLRDDLGQAGRELAKRRFDQQIMFKAVKDEYQRLLMDNLK